MKIYPVEFEAYDDDSMEYPVFKVKAFDELCSEIEIKTVVTSRSWPEISDAILECLRKIEDGTHDGVI